MENNREIKFRAWDGEKMIVVNDIVFSGEKPKAYWRENSVIESSNIIMQYTGLKDKNGIDIYEGDIVKGLTDGEEDIFEIEWHEDKEWSGWEIGRSTDCEVIGNRYENPELLNS